jgi:hypothetical protein
LHAELEASWHTSTSHLTGKECDEADLLKEYRFIRMLFCTEIGTDDEDDEAMWIPELPAIPSWARSSLILLPAALGTH